MLQKHGYKGLITIGKYGFLVLNLEINPQKVDVNVHPAKLEVRFEEESKVFKAVFHAIKDTLLKGDLVANTNSIKPQMSLQESIEDKSTQIDLENTIVVNSKPVEKEETKTLGGLFHKIIKEKEEVLPIEPIQPKLDLEEENTKDKVLLNEEVTATYSYDLPIEGGVTPVMKKPSFLNKVDSKEEQVPKIETKEVEETLKETMNALEQLKMEDKPESFDEMYMRTFGTMPSEVRKVAQEQKKQEEKITMQPEELKSVENISIFPKEEVPMATYKFIGIAFSTYIILELDKELYILDQHAAHERILYERVKKNYYSEEEKDSQLMLLPDIINLSHKEMDIARENMDMFKKAGFTLEEFGENTIKLSGVPNVCINLDTKELFLETLDEINTIARTAKQEKEEKFIATVACKAAVKANMALTEEEVDNLMKQLLVLPNPFTCPHGRPTAIKMTKTDIEKKFSRR